MSKADDLQRAYQLIRENKPEEAEALLLPVLLTDSENVDAWWLMAYAVEDPNEVREALNKVLELDPLYSQAPKAREMLAQLDAQHPPTVEELLPRGEKTDEFGSDIDESFFDDSYEVGSFDDAGRDLLFDSDFDDDFTASLAPPEEGMLTAEELFGQEDEDIFGHHETEETSTTSQPSAFVLPEPEEPLDDETRAGLEEKVARRQGRGRRWLTMLLFVLVVFGIPAAIILSLLSGGDDVSDPGPLEAVVVESQPVNDARFNAGNELRSILGTDSQAVIAKSKLGNTLFAKICAQPGPEVPDQIWKAMETVVHQAPQLQGELAAVGVSVENCSGTDHDTYYRASVSIEDAVRYINSEFMGEIGVADFQALWKKS